MVVAIFKETPIDSIQFRQLNGRIANSADMAFTYGLVEISGAAAKKTNLRYFRIWKKVNNEWKIVFDLLG